MLLLHEITQPFRERDILPLARPRRHIQPFQGLLQHMQGLYPPRRNTEKKLGLTHLNQYHTLALAHRKAAEHTQLPAQVLADSARAAQQPSQADDYAQHYCQADDQAY